MASETFPTWVGLAEHVASVDVEAFAFFFDLAETHDNEAGYTKAMMVAALKLAADRDLPVPEPFEE